MQENDKEYENTAIDFLNLCELIDDHPKEIISLIRALENTILRDRVIEYVERKNFSR